MKDKRVVVTDGELNDAVTVRLSPRGTIRITPKPGVRSIELKIIIDLAPTLKEGELK